MIQHECPECFGEGRLEYEKAVVDWEHGGYLTGYMDDCFRCEGSGEVKVDFSFLTWAKDIWADEKYDNKDACLKTWFRANRQSLLDGWRQEVGLSIF